MDMNSHYLELLCFLDEVLDNPEVILRKEHEVFFSEKQLYGESKVLNHRQHKNVKAVYSKLFTESGNESSIFFPMIVKGVASMREKLLSYAEKASSWSRILESRTCCERGSHAPRTK